jgi:hypothetical protein
VATAGDERPEPCPLEGALNASKLGVARDDVLEEAQLPSGANNTPHLVKCRRRVWNRAQHSATTAASTDSSASGRCSARASTTVTGTGAREALSRARLRRYGSGSTAMTSVTAGGKCGNAGAEVDDLPRETAQQLAAIFELLRRLALAQTYEQSRE